MHASAVVKALVIGLVLLVPPLLGPLLHGEPLQSYLAFPPQTRQVIRAPFSWPVFLGLGTLIVLSLMPFVRVWLRSAPVPPSRPARSFPWWGWLGLTLLLVAWAFAWTRFPWFAELQRHTFTPLWLAFILTMNALTWRRSGQSLLTHRPRLFLSLFPLSCLFWWFFEYLNRFVQNWYYRGVEDFSAAEYVMFNSLAFSTVLPAVLSTVEWLQSFPRLNSVFAQSWKTPLPQSRRFGLILLLAAAAGGACTSTWPDYLFPLIWITPLLAIIGAQRLVGQPTLLRPLASGDWRPVALGALAALFCGLFWELWNFRSLAHWEYSVPFVQRFHLFKMPMLGYAGYLPFGLQCLAAATLLTGGVWEFRSPASAGRGQGKARRE